jgi:hypothetical protein
MSFIARSHLPARVYMIIILKSGLSFRRYRGWCREEGRWTRDKGRMTIDKKFEIRISKQITMTEIQNSKQSAFDLIWNLDIVIWDLFVIWCLQFVISGLTGLQGHTAW